MSSRGFGLWLSVLSSCQLAVACSEPEAGKAASAAGRDVSAHAPAADGGSPDTARAGRQADDAPASAGARATSQAGAGAVRGRLDASAVDDAATADDAGAAPSDAGAPTQVPPFVWQLPAGFPRPFLPQSNPLNEAKVQLGRRLFYDKRLSGNQTQSCASCHEQKLAFTDGRAHSVGSTGQEHPRSALSLANVAYTVSLTWANPLFAMGVMPEPIERQSQLPMYGDSPVELGLMSLAQIEMRLAAVPEYIAWFAQAFPAQADPVTAQNIGRALAAFERTLISGDSPFDRYLQAHDQEALSESAQRGYQLFTSERLACSHCHTGFNLSDHVYYEGKPSIELPYHNTGLYNLDDQGSYPAPNTGVYNVTEDPNDMGKFKAPTLRNIAVTAPYMHDGSIATLSEVLDHYAAGGRSIASGPDKGIGSENPHKDPLVHGFTLSEQERADVLEFLNSLTDRAFLEDPALSDPWQ